MQVVRDTVTVTIMAIAEGESVSAKNLRYIGYDVQERDDNFIS